MLSTTFKRPAIMLLGLGVLLSSIARVQTAKADYAPASLVKAIRQNSAASGEVHVYLTSSPSCNGFAYYKLASGTAKADQMFDLLLAAQLSGKQVTISYYLSNASCMIDGVRLD